MTATAETGTAVDRARAALSDAQLGHVIAGKAEPVASAETLDVLDPCTGQVIASVARGTRADVERAVVAARAAFGGWRATPPAERAKVLTAVAAVVEEHVEELAGLESLNTGKPMGLSREEIPGVAEVFRFMAGAARALQAPATEEYAAGYVSMIRREPHGVIGAITPWNYPLVTASWKMAAALAMGNTMVLKPSELTPLTTLRFMELVGEVLPPGLINVVLGTGAEVGAAISSHPGIDMVSLTGSVASGQRVITDASRSLKPIHLELGGKAPVVVFADADLGKVVEGVRIAGYVNTGQECGAATRILCEEPVRAELTRRLVENLSTIRVGRPQDGEDVEMGPLISEVHRERVAAMVSRAREAGATIALGGDTPEGDGFFYPPTVISDVERGSEITTEEIFGPVITVESFRDEAEAVQLANATAYGLAASVWTQRVGRALRLTSALDFGTVWVNAHLIVPTEMPWGGFGASGHGRECSTLGLEDFSRTKHVMIATDEA